jgi:hypothetical protein
VASVLLGIKRTLSDCRHVDDRGIPRGGSAPLFFDGLWRASGFHGFFVENGLLTPLKCLENRSISRHGDLFGSSTAQNCKNSAIEATQNASFCNAGKKQSGDFPLDAVFTVKIRDTPLHRFSSPPIISGNFMYDTFLVPPLSAGNSTSVRTYALKGGGRSRHRFSKMSIRVNKGQ